MKMLKGDEDYLIPEFYAYTMSNKSTSYEMLQIIAGDTILEEYQIVVLTVEDIKLQYQNGDLQDTTGIELIINSHISIL